MKKETIIKISKALLLIAIITIPAFCIAQTTPYNLNQLESSISSQKTAAKNIVAAIVGLIFIAGVIHVIFAFVNHNQNLKTVVMSYLGAFIAFSALWAFL